jgi:hypothetical protein
MEEITMTAPTPIIQNIKGKDYEVVASRVARFRYDHPERAILTECIHNGEDRVVYKATICDDNHLPIAVGHAEEYRNAGMINKTSATENCETSAIGRALGILGYDVCNSIASADEVERAISQQNSGPFSSSAPAPHAPPPSATPPADQGGGAARGQRNAARPANVPDDCEHIKLRKYYDNTTSKGQAYLKCFADVNGEDMDVVCWEDALLQQVRDACPGELVGKGEFDTFRGKRRFKLTEIVDNSEQPPVREEMFNDSDIPF